MVTFDFLNPLNNVTPRFTEEQLTEIIEWFDDNAKPILVINDAAEPTNVITIEQLQQFLGLKKFHRRNFHYPSYHEIMTEMEGLSMDKHRMLIRDQFIYILDKWVTDPNMKNELKLAFKVFDTDNRDFLEVELLKRIVTQYDNPFTEAEVIEFIRDANVNGSGNVYYENFVERMFENAPELYELEKEYVYEDPDEDPLYPPLPPEPEPVEPAAPDAPPPATAVNETAKGAAAAKGGAAAAKGGAAKGKKK